MILSVPNPRASAALLLTGALVGLLASAGGLIFLPYSIFISTAHISFALLFSAGVIWHLLYNLPVLQKYWRKQVILLPVVTILLTLVASAAYMLLPPFNALHNFQKDSKGRNAKVDLLAYDWQRYQVAFPTLDYQFASSTQQESTTQQPKNIAISLSTASALRSHMLAAWLETPKGEHVHTLALVYRGSKDALPLANQFLPHLARTQANLSAVSNTWLVNPYANQAFMLQSSVPQIKNGLVLKVELNRLSDDTADFPEDRSLGWAGRDGQPSIVYQGTLTLDSTGLRPVELLPAGLTQADGSLYQPLLPTTIDTAVNHMMAGAP